MIIDADERRKNFLNVLHRGGRFAYAWTRPSRTSYWWEAGRPRPEIPDSPQHHDVYFAVHPVMQIPQFDENNIRQPQTRVRGRKDNVAATNCVFADFDAAGFGGSLTETRKYVASLDQPQPTFTVCSGGGIHAYWVFDNPWVLESNGERQVAAQLQRAWVELVGGDVHATDLARVLRMPGTVNHKPEYGPAGAPVEFEVFEPGRTYSIEALRARINPDDLEPRPDPVNRQSRVATAEEMGHIMAALADLSPDRVNEYGSWVEVGMALVELGDVGLALWRDWSRKSDKYREGECEYKWSTFRPFAGITLGSLYHRAGEDREAGSPGPHITRAKKPKTSLQVERAFGEMGAHFAFNDISREKYINGERMTTTIHDTFFCTLHDHGYSNERLMDAVIEKLAGKNHFNPIVDYLTGIHWDETDHIARLAGYFQDEHDVFRSWLTHWLVGAVARVVKGNVQNRVLVLDGKQNTGKSFFAQWLFQPLPEYFVEAAIDPDDKDARIRRTRVWGWEIDEMGATIRRRDREALKAFITNTMQSDRAPYDRYQTTVKPICSFIGTINNEAGFLNDPTGNRRFMVATVNRINWRYSTEVDVNQVWAQAYAMLMNGYKWELSGEEYELSEKLCRRDYRVEDPLEDVLADLIVKDGINEFTTAACLATLQRGGYIRSSTDRADAMRVASLLKEMGLKKKVVTTGLARNNGWFGARLNQEMVDRISLNGHVD